MGQFGSYVCAFILGVGAILFSTSSFANGVDAISVRPMKGTRFWALPDAHINEKPVLSFSAAYQYRPFQVEISNGARLKAVEEMWLQVLGMSSPIVAWPAELGIQIPFVLAGQFYNPNTGDQYDHKPVVMGDFEVWGKREFKFSDKNAFSFALLPYLRMGSGDEQRHTSIDSLSLGLDSIAAYQFSENLEVGAKMGVFFRDPYSIGQAHFSHEIHYGAGVRYQWSHWATRWEWIGRLRLNKPLSDALENPLETFVSLEREVSSSCFVSGGGSLGVVRGSGAPYWSLFAGFQIR